MSSRHVPGIVLERRTARSVALGVAGLRAVLGVSALAMPGWVAAPWIGREAAATPGARLLGRALGGRDLALGLGALLAAQHDAPLRGWVEAGLLSDTGDTLATLLAFKKLPRFTRWLILATTLGAVAAAALCAPFLDA